MACDSETNVCLNEPTRGDFFERAPETPRPRVSGASRARCSSGSMTKFRWRQSYVALEGECEVAWAREARFKRNLLDEPVGCRQETLRLGQLNLRNVVHDRHGGRNPEASEQAAPAHIEEHGKLCH